MFIDVKRRNWPSGLCEYKNEDLMDRNYVYDFCLGVVAEYISKLPNVVPLYASPDVNTIPSLRFKQNNKMCFAFVEGSIYPEKPVLSGVHKYRLSKLAKTQNYTFYYAPVVFGSSDPIRFEKGICLIGDEYYAKFNGLEEIPYDNELLSTNYMFEKLELLGEGYKNCDLSIFEDLISDNCKWHSNFSDATYYNKSEIVQYYKDKFENVRNADSEVEYFLFEFKGDMSKRKVNRRIENGKPLCDLIYYKQKDKYPILFVGQKLNGNKNGLLIIVEFDSNGLFSNIKLTEPTCYDYTE